MRRNEIKQEVDCVRGTDQNRPEKGSVWEDPIIGRHYEVVSPRGMNITLEEVGGSEVVTVDARNWPRQFVEDSVL